MAKKVRWSQRSVKDRKEIFTYWNQKNQSNAYSQKLQQLFKHTAKLLSESPYLGYTVQNHDIRIITVLNYLLLYEIKEDCIYILTIWDGRRNPNDFNQLISKLI